MVPKFLISQCAPRPLSLKQRSYLIFLVTNSASTQCQPNLSWVKKISSCKANPQLNMVRSKLF